MGKLYLYIFFAHLYETFLTVRGGSLPTSGGGGGGGGGGNRRPGSNRGGGGGPSGPNGVDTSLPAIGNPALRRAVDVGQSAARNATTVTRRNSRRVKEEV